jgi:hypothetical protein
MTTHYSLLVGILAFAASTSAQEPATTSESTPKLTVFRENNFGIRFSHTDKVRTEYNPHGSADRVIIQVAGLRAGALLVRPAPPAASIKQFMEAGKDSYKQKHNAQDLSYTIHTAKSGLEFHYLTGKISVQAKHVVLHRYIYLPPRTPARTEADAFLKAISQIYSFEFMVPADRHEELKPEIDTIINTFSLAPSP